MNEKYTVALAGNPNVGKSTIFNSLTGMHQHTGNWPGKTVANAVGEAIIHDKEFLFVDIPGTYSLMSHSEEEEIARDYICSGKSDVTVVVVDSTCLERNLNLAFQIMELTPNVILCVNLLDEAKKKKIKINIKKLSELLGIPVVGTTAKKKKTLENLKDMIYKVSIGEIKCNPKVIEYENNEKLLETFKEKYKGITNRFVEAKKNRDASVILAKEIYELLALELGVEERQKEDDDRIQIKIPNAQLEGENSIEETQRKEQQGLPYIFPTFQNEEERE